MPTALVVDDSPIELLVTKALLERLGYTPLTASNGEDALKTIQEESPDFVICDITMPGMSGIDLLDATRNLDPPPVFIMATGLDDAGNAVNSMQRGAYGYLTKPLKADALRDALNDAGMRRRQELNASEERDRLSKTDPLTGLLNKDTFRRCLTSYVESQRRSDQPLAVLFINIDGLRYVNNTYDHTEGDHVLQHVAAILQRSVRPSDIVARYGGDVFSLALIGMDPAYVHIKAKAIADSVEEKRIMLREREYSLTVTIGAALSDDSMTMDSLIDNADLALLLAKEKGRNQIYLYHQDDEVRRREYGALFNNLETLRQTIEHNRFNMHYQPIVHLSSGEAHHYEALIRMRDESDQVLPPDVFIKVAEKFGLSTRIDCMVVSACMHKLAELSVRGSDAGLAINLSGKSVGNAELLALIKNEIAAHGIDPRRIIFEITETAAFHNLDLVRDFVSEVKQLGCRFALDDFGVGFSSFYYIKQLDIDYLKIDGSFIRNLLDNANDRVFVQAMVEISRVYGMKVVAEWVENTEILALLRDMGVDYGQGYHFGKPAPDCQ